MITYQQHAFYQDGKPLLLLAGEVHYFRLPMDRWDDILNRAKEMGLNCIATYVPWIAHVEREHDIDFGQKTDHFNLRRFIQLAQKKGFVVFLRPGPYIMAEMMNEGIPEWVFEKYPDLKPKTLEGKDVKGPIVDYLHPGFLYEVKLWYEQVLHEVFDLFQQHQGPIFGLQLDNEIGMLAWVTKQTLTSHEYPVTSPKSEDGYQRRLLAGRGERAYYLAYALKLQAIFEELGVKDMNYFINIHGTSHGRGKTFPIGISQLLSTWQKTKMIPGTDVYFGDLNLEDFHDYYIIHALLDATLTHDQPLTSLEFNVGDGNFGDNLAARQLPSAADFKLRMNIAQNYRMINYYLLTGGFNPLFKYGPLRENPFVAITGERHGYAAPIQPDGSTNYTYFRLAETTRMLGNLSPYLATQKQIKDPVAIAWISDQYMTSIVDTHYPEIEDVQRCHEMHRNSIIWDQVIKHLLLLHYQLDAIDLDQMMPDPKKHKLLVVPQTKYMAHEIQEKLVSYLNLGGKLILAGECPTRDTNGKPDLTLMHALGIEPKPILYDWEVDFLILRSEQKIQNTHHFRSNYAQPIQTDHQALFTRMQTGEKVGMISDQAVVITSGYPGHIAITKSWLDHFHFQPKLNLSDHQGHLVSLVQGDEHPHFIHLINLDHIDQTVNIGFEHMTLFNGQTLHIMAQDAIMLPLSLDLPQGHLVDSTAELIEISDHHLSFRLTQPQDVIHLITPRLIELSNDYIIRQECHHYTIISKHHAKVKKTLILHFN